MPALRHALIALPLVALLACGQAEPTVDSSTAKTAQAADSTRPPAPEATAAIPPAADAPDRAATLPETGEQGGTDDWRQVASADDQSRIARLDQAWRLARAEAEDRGLGDELADLGALADPDAALADRAQPSPGDYRCRTVHLGSHDGAGLGLSAYGWFRCRVQLSPGGDLVLTNVTGSQRPRGRLYPDGDDRIVFLGAQAWGDQEAGFPAYGQMPERDLVGVVERIGERRWRLVTPWPRQDAKLKIMELVG